MNILGLIFARKGSKRLKNKNIKYLKNKPLIYWTLKLSKQKNKIINYLLSTNYSSINKLIKNFNIVTNGKRPEYLSTSKSTSYEVANYEIKKYEKKYTKINIIVLLQPTSPFRSNKILNKAINIFIDNKMRRSVVSCNKKSNKLFPNGNFYITSPELIKQEKNFYSNKSIYVPMSHPRFSIDIDTYSDYIKAKKYLEFLN